MDILLGNEQLQSRLRAAFARGTLSHCYLISGPVGSGRGQLVKLLCLAMLCTDEIHRPCLHCPQCRKVLAGTHPDVIVVDDPGKKTIPVELVRRARADAFIRPNEGAKKIYIFPRAQDLNESGQNALLKILEEPPQYGVFLLVSDRADRLLPTIRSRCAELTLSPLPEETVLHALAQRFPTRTEDERRAAANASGGILGAAIAQLSGAQPASERTAAFGQAFAQGDRLALLELTTGMTRLQRDALERELSDFYQLLHDALCCRAGRPGSPLAQTICRARAAEEILSAMSQLRRALEYITYNVGVGHILGMLAARL